jgi:hypothetical protein
VEVERKYDELRETHEVEVRNLKEEGRRRKRAEARVEELEQQLGVRSREVEEVKAARAKDAQELLGNAKERLAILHEEVSLGFAGASQDVEQGRTNHSFQRPFEQTRQAKLPNTRKRWRIS